MAEGTSSSRLLTSLSVGISSGLGLLVAQIAFATFIFSGPLAPYTSLGIGLVLFGNFSTCLIFAWVGGFRGAISGLPPAVVVVMAAIASTMTLEHDQLFITTVLILMAGAVVTGVICLVIGHFRLANLIRLIPYPVAGGFVAGIGGVVCLEALSLMGADSDMQASFSILNPLMLGNLIPGVVYGVALYFAVKCWAKALILPVSVILLVGVSHISFSALGISGDEAQDLGLLLSSAPEAGLWPAFVPEDLVHFSWPAFADQIPNLVALVLVALVCIVMNVAGLEHATNQELDWDREFRTAGYASVVSGLGGGTVGSMIVPASLRSKLFGANTRLTGTAAALVIGFALFLGSGFLNFVPVSLVGGILIFAGLAMLDEGLVKSYKPLPLSEYGIILLIFFVITTVGLFEGVGAGMVAMLLFFAVRLSRLEVVRSQFTLSDRQSRRIRPIPDRAILLEEGKHVHVCLLSGYIFFGSVSPLADQLKRSLSGTNNAKCLLLDFDSVSGVDFSAVSILSRFFAAADKAHVTVVTSALSDKLERQLERSMNPELFEKLQSAANIDQALEICEDIILEDWKSDIDELDELQNSLLQRTTADLEHHLDRQVEFESLIDELEGWFRLNEYNAGEKIWPVASNTESIQLLLSGRASASDSQGERLHQYGPGDAIWPIHDANSEMPPIVADESCRTAQLAASARLWIEDHEVHLAMKLYRYLLSGKNKAVFSNSGDGQTGSTSER